MMRTSWLLDYRTHCIAPNVRHLLTAAGGTVDAATVVMLGTRGGSRGGHIFCNRATVHKHRVTATSNHCILDIGVIIVAIPIHVAVRVGARSLGSFRTSVEGFIENSDPVAVHGRVWCNKADGLSSRAVADGEAQFATVFCRAWQEVDGHVGVTN